LRRSRPGCAGGKTLFIGPPDAQATGIWRELTPVTDVASAQRAIELIIEQGEGTPADQEDNHFRRFIEMLTEYRKELAATPAFQPARPVVQNPLLDLQRDQPVTGNLGVNLITDQLARDVIEIFGAIYARSAADPHRYFAHTDEDDEQLTLKSAFST
jgi:hypothetical protein